MKMRSCVAAVAVFCLAAATAPAATFASSDRLPDLAMYRLLDFTIEKTPDHHRLLRYTTIIVDIGAGKFQAEGSRSSSAQPEMSVVQRIFDDVGGSRTRPTAARMYFAGDGHTHWHLRDLEQSALTPLDDDQRHDHQQSLASAKHGFCFFDNIKFNLLLPGAPLDAFYLDCGDDPTALSQTMGLSVGWGDAYWFDIVDQWIDITGVKNGRYRLTSTADAQNSFLESDETNNVTWTDLHLHGNATPRVIGQGPFAPLPVVP